MGPTAWLRFWFPGIEDATREYQRGYTIKNVDLNDGSFVSDFVLHDPPGPASHWAANAQAGMSIKVTLLGSTKFTVPDDKPEGYLLLGDSASIPGIDDIIDSIPAEIPIELYLEQHSPHDAQIPLAEHPRLNIHWFQRDDQTSFASVLEPRDWSSWVCWVGIESGSLKHVRKKLKEDFGFPRTEVLATGYWVEGKAMGKEWETLTTATEKPNTSEPASDDTRSKGQWKSNSAGKLLAPLKPVFWTVGVIQGLITLLELVPFVLLIELA